MAWGTLVEFWTALGDSLMPLWYTLDVSMGALGFLGCLLRGLGLLKVARNASRMHFGRRMKTCKN